MSVLPVAQQHHRHRGVPVVDHRGLVLVLRIPQRVIGIRQCGDVLGHLVVTPADAGGVDGVGHGEPPLLVVPRVGEDGPDIADVRDVAVIERLQQTTVDEPADLVVAREVDVVIDIAAADLGDGLVGVVEGRHLDLGLVLVLERLDRVRGDVVGVAVELQRGALLGRETVGDRLVVRRDVPGDRILRGRDLQARCRRRRRGAGRTALRTRVEEQRAVPARPPPAARHG